jgi:hypothetical protein
MQIQVSIASSSQPLSSLAAKPHCYLEPCITEPLNPQNAHCILRSHRILTKTLPSPHSPDLSSSHPINYLPSILWWFEDCKNDPDVHISPGNKSCPPIWHVIWHLDGKLITPKEWRIIHLVVVTIVSTCLHSLSMRHPSTATQQQMMSFYQHYFIKEWNQVVRELEVLAPLLSYCARTWKGGTDTCVHLTGQAHSP